MAGNSSVPTEAQCHMQWCYSEGETWGMEEGGGGGGGGGQRGPVIPSLTFSFTDASCSVGAGLDPSSSLYSI